MIAKSLEKLDQALPWLSAATVFLMFAGTFLKLVNISFLNVWTLQKVGFTTYSLKGWLIAILAVVILWLSILIFSGIFIRSIKEKLYILSFGCAFMVLYTICFGFFYFATNFYPISTESFFGGFDAIVNIKEYLRLSFGAISIVLGAGLTTARREKFWAKIAGWTTIIIGAIVMLNQLFVLGKPKGTLNFISAPLLSLEHNINFLIIDPFGGGLLYTLPIIFITIWLFRAKS